MSGAPRPARLPAGALRRHCDPKALGFRTTDELEPFEGLIGQDRALEAIDLGARMEKPGFHLFVLGRRRAARPAGKAPPPPFPPAAAAARRATTPSAHWLSATPSRCRSLRIGSTSSI